MSATAIATFGASLGLGLTYSIVPGPPTIEALRRGAARGTRALVSVRLGALGGSLLWAVAVLTGVGVAMQSPQCRVALTAAGSAVLVLLVGRALQRARTGGGESTVVGARRGDALAGALLGTANPLAAAFWLGVAGPTLGGATSAGRAAAAGAFIAGFVVSHLMWTAALTVIVGCGRGVGGGRLTRMANLAAIAPLAWFALSPLVRAL